MESAGAGNPLCVGKEEARKNLRKVRIRRSKSEKSEKGILWCMQDKRGRRSGEVKVREWRKKCKI